MTFGEWIEENRDKKIEVGAGGGSGFFFIGKAETMFKNIEVYDRYLSKYCAAMVARMQRKLKVAIERSPTLADYLANKLRRGEKPTLDGYMTYIDRHIKKVNATVKTLEARAKDAERLEPLRGRDVIEVYESIKDKGYINVIISGTERGKYWDKSETGKTPFCMAEVDDE